MPAHLDLYYLLLDLKLINAYATSGLLVLHENLVEWTLNCVFSEKFFDASHQLCLLLILIILLFWLLRGWRRRLYKVLWPEDWHRPYHLLLRHMIYYEMSLLVLSKLLLLLSYKIGAVHQLLWILHCIHFRLLSRSWISI